MSTSLVVVVHSLRKQMNAATMTTITKACEVNDRNGDGIFDVRQMEEILNTCGVFCKKQDFKRLYKHFEGKHYSEFVGALRGKMSARREAMVKKVWETLWTGAMEISVKVFWSQFDANKHPLVKAGAKSAQQIADEQQAVFTRSNVGAYEGSIISFHDFRTLYCDVSASEPYDDQAFVDMLQSVWGVVEDPTDFQISAHQIANLKAALWEKVRQRKKLDGEGEYNHLRLSLQNQFDGPVEDAEMVDYPTFVRGLQLFGFDIHDDLTRALFEEHAYGGLMSVPSFSADVCGIDLPARLGDSVGEVAM
jgi:hypothetical protein